MDGKVKKKLTNIKERLETTSKPHLFKIAMALQHEDLR
jgi:hypothetical protein